jgi:hypothetical protein
MHEEVKRLFEQAEKTSRSVEDVVRIARSSTLDAFAEFLLHLPSTEFQNLSKLLPAMASTEVQEQWTGASGYSLLRQSVSFVQNMHTNFVDLTGKTLENSNVLDFGCGWGRLLRLMLFFTKPQNLYGCDAWPQSLTLAQESGVPAHLALSKEMPEELPFVQKFDLIYAFSIFTHLSKPCTHACLNAIRKSIKQDGLLILTVRPVEFWQYSKDAYPDWVDRLITEHNHEGFAFRSHAADNPLSTYGDTSISKRYIEEKFEGWQLVRFGHSVADPYQVSAFLKPA